MNDYGLTQALYQYLLNDSSLIKAINGIYTHIPEDEPAPYLHFYISELVPGNLNPDKPKASLQMQFDFYSQYKGVAELHGIMGHLSRLLQGLNLNLAWNQKKGLACFKELSQRQTLLQNEVTRKGSIMCQIFMQF